MGSSPWKGLHLVCLTIFACTPGCNSGGAGGQNSIAPVNGAFHVYPGESIQDRLDAAADSSVKNVIVHEGVYRPAAPAQALIWFNSRHDGIQLLADGIVELRGDNPEVADRGAASYPAIVNHVIYLGDGITEKTFIRGFSVTGANGFITEEGTDLIQPETGIARLERSQFFFSDGGGIKIFGRSYPTIEDLHIHDNYARPCGGGVSVEHRGFSQKAVTFRNCVFRNNRCQLTGSAVDVLPGSSAVLFNCLFLGNIGNTEPDNISPEGKAYNAEHGSGALTVFPESRVRVENCTFTGNANGVDDKGRGNQYVRCIFWKNTEKGHPGSSSSYEFDIIHAVGVTECSISGENGDLRSTISPDENIFNADDPVFDSHYTPHGAGYENRGCRLDAHPAFRDTRNQSHP